MSIVFFVFLGIISMGIVYHNVKNSNFSEKESFFWMLASLIVMILPFCIPILNLSADKLGVEYPPSLLFLLSILFLFFLLFRLSKYLFIEHERIKELSQKLAILEFQIEELSIYKEIDEKR